MREAATVEGPTGDSDVWGLPTAASEGQGNAPQRRELSGFGFSAGADYRVQSLPEAWQTDQTDPRPKAVDADRRLRVPATGQEKTRPTVCWGRRFGVPPPPCDARPLSKLYGCLKTNHKEQKERAAGRFGGRTFRLSLLAREHRGHRMRR